MAKRVPKQQPDPAITVDSFGGLDLQPDVLSRPPNSWAIAQNVDLFVPGSMRKVVGPQTAFTGFPVPIWKMFNYRRDSGALLTMMGVGTNGHLYDLSTSNDIVTLGTLVNPPWVGQFQGNEGGSVVTYLVALIQGGTPVKYENTTGVTAVGVSEPASGITITPTNSATNSNAYFMQVGIQYLWTYWNPTTLHESSPSPVTNAAIMSPTVNTPSAATPYTTQIALSIPTAAPSVGDGYTRIRVYRTRDGGATFFLLPTLYNSGGSNLLDANFSALITGNPMTVYDGVAAHSLAPAPDQLMVNPPGGAPAVGANNPPPIAIWGANYQNRLWLLDANGLRLWFSNLGDFQSFGVFNFMDFSKDIYDSIKTMLPLSDRMIVFGRNSTRQITGTDFSDFVEVPVDMRRGIIGRNSAVNDGDNIYAFTQQSLTRLSFAQAGPPFVGDRIKPYTDTINSQLYSVIRTEIDTARGQMLAALPINSSTYNDQILVTDLSKESPFTILTGFSSEILDVAELEKEGGGSKDLYISLADTSVYLLHGTSGSLSALLQTQALPLEDYDIWRVFKWFSMFGSDLKNWHVSWSIGLPDPTTGDMTFTTFSTPIAIGALLGNRSLPVGAGGRQIVFRFTHNTNNGVGALISRYTIPYEDKVSN